MGSEEGRERDDGRNIKERGGGNEGKGVGIIDTMKWKRKEGRPPNSTTHKNRLAHLELGIIICLC